MDDFPGVEMDQKHYFQYLGIRLDGFEVYTKTKN